MDTATPFAGFLHEITPVQSCKVHGSKWPANRNRRLELPMQVCSTLPAEHSSYFFLPPPFFLQAILITTFQILYFFGSCIALVSTFCKGGDFFGAITPGRHIRTRCRSFADRASQMRGGRGVSYRWCPSRASTDDHRTATPIRRAAPSPNRCYGPPRFPISLNTYFPKLQSTV